MNFSTSPPCDTLALWHKVGEKTSPREKPLPRTLEWQVQRIAAAFGVAHFDLYWYQGCICYQGLSQDSLVSWRVDARSAAMCSVSVGDSQSQCIVSLEPNLDWGSSPWQSNWELSSVPHFHEEMARGLYCLDFDDHAVLAQLQCPLSRHEKMHLQDHLPREFWPAKWLHESSLS